MKDQITTDLLSAQSAQAVKQILSAWTAQNNAITAVFNKYEEATYQTPVAPGRNRAIYVLGHLVAMNDALLPLLGLQDKLHPNLETLFLTEADQSNEVIPGIAELNSYWEEINETLSGYFEQMSLDQWLERHTRVSEEDFILDPLRNKLNIIISRTIHSGYHLGQLAFLSPRVALNKN